MIAYSLIRPEPLYRRDAFAAGLAAAGYEVRHAVPGKVNQGDVLLLWNRYSDRHDLATSFEKAGGIVLVAENAYIWKGGISPHHLKDRPAYALARGYHNDASVVQEGGPERWSALGVNLAPWRVSGGHVLVCPNRSFGTPGRIMPPNWANEVRARLAKLTKREIRVRPHPGNDAPQKPLAEDLAGCWAVVIWSSSAGVHALVAGIPVICCAPAWICKGASYLLELTAIEGVGNHDDVLDGNRESAMHRLAWAQWSIQEIATGEPFAHLLRPARQAEVAASA